VKELLRLDTKNLALASILGALSAVFEIIPGPPFDINFPLYPRVSWDLTGFPMMISLFFSGPLSAVLTCVIGCSIIFIRGNIVGGVFKLIAELATILAFAAVRKGVIAKSIGAISSRVLMMSVVNYYLLPFFYSMPEAVVISLLIPLGIFNITQALINIIPAHIIHSRLGKRWQFWEQKTKLDQVDLK
jgi:riboflavin transporter FmnP